VTGASWNDGSYAPSSDSLEAVFGASLVARDRRLAGATLADWEPQPGTIDLALVTCAMEPRVTFEAKIDDIEWTLWDIYKMVSATLLPTVDAAYVVVAAQPVAWESSRDCAELFRPEPEFESKEVEWYSSFLFSEYRRAWRDLLGGGRGRLLRVPNEIRLTRIGEWPLPAYPCYELRALRVAAVEDSGWLTFDGDWPAEAPTSDIDRTGWPRLIPTDELGVLDLPSKYAEEQAYHDFALSFDGYRELGSFPRCTRIANGALAAWRESGDLPATMRELRACLFFEQRRWHHYGYGFDDETMAYLRALVAQMRGLLDTG
jgi:hypothetical protein